MTDSAPLLEVRNLRTEFLTDAGPVRAVDGVSFEVEAGATVGIVGESGSGKSVTALSILRLLAENARIGDGSRIAFRGRDLATLDEDEIRRLRGGEIAMIFQDPLTSLNPVLRISKQLVEGMLAHGRQSQAEALRHGIDLLARMGINAPERAVSGYPHEFSGGMRQRVMLAMGFANNPSLLIADEPTTALDVTIQAQILDLLKTLNREFGTAVLLISHDLGVIANVCERVLVMYAGEVVEEGPAEALLAEPRHPYTWALLNAVPRLDQEPPADKRLTAIEGAPPDPSEPPSGCRFRPRCPFAVERCGEHPDLLPVAEGRKARCWVTQAGERLLKPSTAAAVSAPAAEAGQPMLSLRNVVKHYPLRRDALFSPRKVVHAVDGVDLDIGRGETVGLVGESGSGKSTIARLITRIQKPTAGSIRFGDIDLATADRSVLRPLRRRIQMIFQDPYASLNPRMTVGQILSEPLRFHRLVRGPEEAKARVGELLEMVGLSARAAERYPHEFSGGQRQRIGTARALAVEPELIIADEPISALDVNIRAQIINLFVGLQQRLGLTFLFIAHDLAVVRQVSDRIVVLYLGKVMEVATARDLFAEPLHPYTRSLISAAPIPDVAAERKREHIRLAGEPPSPVAPPSGCRFRTRCPVAQGICAEIEPPLAEYRPGHRAACHFSGQA
ncbi:MAG: ABC transporter ATP-binding protein [Alphaproteobacteria bacterium]|nr:ABC transporter ATP-binding protein [Alphaproteobacteria bacterium]